MDIKQELIDIDIGARLTIVIDALSRMTKSAQTSAEAFARMTTGFAEFGKATLDTIGITIDCRRLTPYSRAVRWWLRLPNFIAPLFPRLHKRAMRERMQRQAEMLSMILAEVAE